jgi:hypothetical protein
MWQAIPKNGICYRRHDRHIGGELNCTQNLTTLPMIYLGAHRWGLGLATGGRICYVFGGLAGSFARRQIQGL